MEFSVIKNNKGGDSVIVNNFKFNFKSNTTKGRRFKCIDCPTYIILEENVARHTQLGTNELQPPIHNHPNHQKIINNNLFAHDVKLSIQNNPTKRVKTNYQTSLIKHLDKVADLPTYHESKSRFCKQRQRYMPKSPKCRRDFEINGYLNTFSGDQFFQINDGKYR